MGTTLGAAGATIRVPRTDARTSATRADGTVDGTKSIGAGQAAEAKRFIEQAADAASDATAGISNVDGVPVAVKLRPVSRSFLARAERDLRTNLLWVDDDACRFRAVLGAMHLNTAERPGSPIGVADALAAGIATVARPTTGTRTLAPSKLWDFHAAVVMRVEGESEPVVLDYLLFDQAVPLSKWAARLGVDARAVELHTPVAATTYVPQFGDQLMTRPEGAPYTYGDYQAIASVLTGIWERTARDGTASNVLRQRNDPVGAVDTAERRRSQDAIALEYPH